MWLLIKTVCLILLTRRGARFALDLESSGKQCTCDVVFYNVTSMSGSLHEEGAVSSSVYIVAFVWSFRDLKTLLRL